MSDKVDGLPHNGADSMKPPYLGRAAGSLAGLWRGVQFLAGGHLGIPAPAACSTLACDK